MSGKILGIVVLAGLLVLVFVIRPSYVQDERVDDNEQHSGYQESVEEWRDKFASEGIERAYAAYLAYAQGLPYFQSHKLAHIVGEILYEELGGDAISHCTQDFGFGCYHAVAGAALSDEGLSTVSDLAGSCNATGDGRIAFGCIHGIGHGILAHLGNDEFVEALDVCTPVQAGTLDIGGCWGGVFMEYNFNTMQSDKGIDLRPFDTSLFDEPCRSLVPERFKRACYYELPAWWRASLVSGGEKREYVRLGEMCRTLHESAFVDTCFRGIGNTAGPVSEYKLVRMQTFCAEMPVGYDTLCLSEALNHLIQDEAGMQQLKDFCANEQGFEDVCRTLRP